MTDNLFKNLVAQQKSQWECDSCMTRNEMDKTKCLCCDTVRRDSGISSQQSISSSIKGMNSYKLNYQFKNILIYEIYLLF